MNTVVYRLLRALFLESKASSDELIVQSFKESMELLISYKKSLFESVIRTSSYDLGNENAAVESDYFEEEGVLLYDMTDSKPANKSLYIYRSNGIRVFLMESGLIKIVTPYSLLSSLDCSFVQHDIDSSGLQYIKNLSDVEYVLKYMEWHKEMSTVQNVIKILVSIKEKYPRGYFIEQFLYPQDMNVKSEFSTNISNMLWETLLSKGFYEKHNERDIEVAMKKLLDIDIKPSFDTLMSFINSNINSDLKHIKMVVEHINTVSLSEVRTDVKEIKLKKESLIEAKLGFFGFTVNLRELFRRITSL
jgi:hypothetical protein